MKTVTLIVLAVLLSPNSARAAGDVANGHMIARLWCANCHVISDDGEGKDIGPPLPMVAREAPGHLRSFLTGPHPPMPNFNLSREEIDDVVAYLHSLAGR